MQSTDKAEGSASLPFLLKLRSAVGALDNWESSSAFLREKTRP